MVGVFAESVFAECGFMVSDDPVTGEGLPGSVLALSGKLELVSGMGPSIHQGASEGNGDGSSHTGRFLVKLEGRQAGCGCHQPGQQAEGHQEYPGCHRLDYRQDGNNGGKKGSQPHEPANQHAGKGRHEGREGIQPAEDQYRQRRSCGKGCNAHGKNPGQSGGNPAPDEEVHPR